MRDGLRENTRAIFDNEDVVLLTDDARLADWLTESGVRAATFAGVLSGRDAPPPQAIVVPLDYGRLPSRRALRDILAKTSVLWMSLASFSSDLEAAKYAIEKFSEIDIPRSVAMNRRVLTQLLLAREEVALSGPGTELKLRLPDALQLVSRTRLELLPDEHSTVGNYFEVAMSPTDLAGKIDPDLSISGSLRIDSVLVAKHRELKGVRADRFTAAAEIAEEMRKACPLYVTVVDNRFVDGFGPWAEGIDATSGPEYQGAVTEVALGTGMLPPENLDWSLNCLLNEGAAGIHLGVGNGLTGMHFDFISTEARLDIA